MAKQYAEIDLAPMIDHSLLSPWATPEQVEQWCAEADLYGFAAVCVAPCYVKQAVEDLHQKSPQVCTVIGFPTGTQTSSTKLYEAQEAAEHGATELDVVINLGAVKTGNHDLIHQEIANIHQETGLVIKAILETTVLNPAEKRLAAEICMDAGAQFLKTSTGWHGGATVDDVRLLRELSRDRVRIKASGGIRTAAQAYELVLAGATRIGTSQGLALLKQAKQLDQVGG
ncbi:deoxyribose-phosphate aldolase [filamentous cyanobacterium LEGE 11480]|uniref:Deoxyribose-phosphate aldolase n=1 Tax=Romeriopsis navalis LEGE 11480 TaxID=2777977 RepID=A0A928VGG3_9CYAN|nr:deoxyribose-phosphate aldolase [Romeriopsis navalis]MBE9028138.1 deoxyribose-phosphate aldolase [Romeriopsis navalis LEGE 11480]